MIWFGTTPHVLIYLCIILAFIGLWITISGVIDLINLGRVRYIHRLIDKLLEDERNEKRR